MSIVNVALPTIEHDLNISGSYLQYVVTTYGILLGGFLLLGGRLADTVGRRRILRVGLLVFGAASLMADLRAANIVAVLLFGTLVTLFFFASLYLQQVLDYSPTRTGLAYVPIAFITAVGTGVSATLVTKIAAKLVLVAGLLLTAAGLMLLWRTPIDANYVIDVLPAFLIAGLGLGMSFVPLQITAFAGVGNSDSGFWQPG